jgi:hypothetical protein
MNYGIVQRDGNTNAEGIGRGGGVGGVEGDAGHVTFYVEVPNIEASLAKAESLGGKRLMGPDEVPGTGTVIAHFSDPEGPPDRTRQRHLVTTGPATQGTALGPPRRLGAWRSAQALAAAGAASLPPCCENSPRSARDESGLSSGE